MLILYTVRQAILCAGDTTLDNAARGHPSGFKGLNPVGIGMSLEHSHLGTDQVIKEAL